MNEVRVNFDDDELAALERRAIMRGHTVEDEVRAIVDERLHARPSRAELIRRADEIAAMTPKGIRQTDSTQLIREDRDR